MKLLKYFIKEWFFPILVTIIFVFLINKFLFFKIKVPSESMYPTIKSNDNIYVTRIYNYKNIKRGDIIVFYSEELNMTLIKRVIGLPGDKIELKSNGDVYVNNSQISEPYIKFIGGKIGNFNVPKDKYFFLGDNRPNSKDSRYWANNYIPIKNIKGKAQIIVYPFYRIGLLK